MVAAVQFQSKILRRQTTPEEYRIYRAGLEWDLADPIVIETRADLKSEYRWRDRLEPYHHQVTNLITFCRRLPVTLLADDVGLGKTISAGLIMSELISRSRLSKVLVVCPKLLGPQWKEELESKFDIPSEVAIGKELLKAEPADVGAIITTYASARLHLDALPPDRFEMLVLDEAHKLRNLFGVEQAPQVAVRFQKALEQRRFRFVLMLTATPIQNRLWDLYSLVELLTVARGHENPFGTPGMFARRFIADDREKARQLKPEAREQFRSIVYGYMSRVRRGEARATATAMMAEQRIVITERKAAQEERAEAQKDHGKLAAGLAGAMADLRGHERARETARERIVEDEAALTRGFPAGIPVDAAAAIDERVAVLAGAREHEVRARRSRDATRIVRDRAAAERQALSDKAATLMQRCASLQGVIAGLTARQGMKPAKAGKSGTRPPGEEIADLAGRIETARGELVRRSRALSDESNREAEALDALLAELGIPAQPGEPAKVLAKAKKAVQEASVAAARAADRAEQLEGKLARRHALDAEIAEARERERLYRALAAELRQDRFIDFLLHESIQQLAAIASQELRSISGDRYSLRAEETAFEVVDHANADETRSVDTLSGGETFLASLSLATALALSITDIAGEAIGGRLEAMFVDEGFGTLDAESLDAVIDALERLRDSERLVGVITHVPQLAERIPDGLVVERTDGGSSVRRR